ncbi:MAG: deoxyguanosinetriphosphate triphosphohydrolase [Oscillospiraceae bacterium]|nr:deoxyguanosinetriphosphate triphosphohydrolase [Oscillospiraceae bacterium]
MNTREYTERLERETLSPRACLSEHSRGRLVEIEPCPMRTCFQRDIDRVVHSKSFRRLKHKTQVFLQPEGDHYRTRMTHTLEVCRIARTMARGLRLNEDLVEAAALGHDLGHTPFGHAGERALSRVVDGGFVHAEQSLRVVDRLENDGAGLNLCYEVRRGILCHSAGERAETLEGQLVRFADKIAYINHDIDDAMRGGIIFPTDIPVGISQVLGYTHGERIATLVGDIIENSGEGDIIRQSEPVAKAMAELKAFMFQAVYFNPLAKGEEGKAEDMICQLFDYYIHHTDKLPSEYQDILVREGEQRAVVDYIAGMTDTYAVQKFEQLFIPMGWMVK